MKQKKLILIVLDRVGVGEISDADICGDQETNTISNIARTVGGLRLPKLVFLELGNITVIKGIERVEKVSGCFGKMAEVSEGKDSTIGHWEIEGIITHQKFSLYSKGFPKSVLEILLPVTGYRGYLGNRSASGTEIITELDDEHVCTGFSIVYTSGDSVFQIAAHHDVISLERLYEICEITRERVLVDEHRVGHVIARPFIGRTENYIRTPNRSDYAVKPPTKRSWVFCSRTIFKRLVSARRERIRECA